jgi:hypothetical protein
MNDKIDFDIEGLAFARAEAAKCKAAMDYLINAVKQSPNYLDLERRMDLAVYNASQIEAQVRGGALANYYQNKDKSPHPAIGIRVIHKIDYSDADARQWCMSNMPNALKLDKTVFEKHAKAVADTIPIPFVTITDEPQATIASDLSKYIETQEVNA